MAHDACSRRERSPARAHLDGFVAVAETPQAVTGVAPKRQTARSPDQKTPAPKYWRFSLSVSSVWEADVCEVVARR